MKVTLVEITELDVVGHIYPEDPDTIHYNIDGIQYETTTHSEYYIVIGEINIPQEET